MQKKIKITIAEGTNPQDAFKTITDLGVLNASLTGNVVTGDAENNLVNPLRSVEGIATVEEQEQPVDHPAPVYQNAIAPNNAVPANSSSFSGQI